MKIGAAGFVGPQDFLDGCFAADALSCAQSR